MNIKAVRTKIVHCGDSVADLITTYLPEIEENSVIAIASKIVAYEQNQWVKIDDQNPNQKHELVQQQADLYLASEYSKYNMMLAIKNHTLTVNAGIDESNADGGFVLWPKDLQIYTNQLWEVLRKKYGLKNLGIIITDSKTTPFRWGVTGVCLAHCGFGALHDYVGEQDLFGRPITMEQTNISEAVAAAATLEMGEVAESQPLAVITEIPLIKFQDRQPTTAEIDQLKIEIEDDVYGPLLTAVDWKKGG